MQLTLPADPTVLRALDAVDFSYVARLRDVWVDTELDVASLHSTLRLEFAKKLAAIHQARDLPIMGWPIVGPGGAGKTHLLGQLRRHAMGSNATFVLVDMTDVRDVWETILQGYLDALEQEVRPAFTQRELSLRRFIQQIAPREPIENAMRFLAQASSVQLKGIASQLLAELNKHKTHRAEVLKHQGVFRAMICMSSADLGIQSMAYAWLQGQQIDAGDRERFGLSRDTLAPSEILRGLAWWLSLSGPTVVAFDQLDAIVQQVECGQHRSGEETEQDLSRSIVKQVGNCFAALRELHWTFPIVSCIEATWSLLPKVCMASFLDRFERPRVLSKSIGGSTGQLIQKRLGAAFAAVEWTPPHPTWPFAPPAIEQLAHESARNALKMCANELEQLRESEILEEVQSFANTIARQSGRLADNGETDQDQAGTRDTCQADEDLDGLQFLDERFAALKQQVNILDLLDEQHEDERLAPLYATLLQCWTYAYEDRLSSNVEVILDHDFTGGKNAKPLHARLKFVLHGDHAREVHCSIRGLEKSHAMAFHARLRAAITHAGIHPSLPFRHLTVVRVGPVSKGEVSQQLIDRFLHMGGTLIQPTEHELRVLYALSRMFVAANPLLGKWLRSRGILDSIARLTNACVPAHAVDLLTRRSDLAPPMSCDPIAASQLTKGQPAVSPKRPTSTAKSVSMPQPTQTDLQAPVQQNKPATDSMPEVEQSTKALVLGKRVEAFASSQTPVGIPVDVLSRHMLVLGASGSGKTVTVRRVVEEAALLGIPSIVIDCAQDMCTFDEPRREPSAFWRAGDVERAQRFAEQTEMVVWTPGRESGNPLRLETIPDFTALRDDEEELQQSVDMAVGALQEIVAQGTSRTAESKRGILASSVKYFARHCSEPTLSSYIDMLGNLPEAAGIEIEKQEKLAQEMADSLKVALACNPLLRSDGAALDPAVLFGDDAPRDRTRISTISFVGLPNQSAQRDFLNQLSMTLFAWIKRYPQTPNGRALRGLLVIDEARDFIPSQHSTVCKQSMQRLVAQARKYKLGIVFATQHPKDIDTKIVGNCASHLYGCANSPASLDTLADLMSMRGGRANDFPRLKKGQFYVHYSDGNLKAPIKTQIADSLTQGRQLEEHEIHAKADASRARLTEN